MNFAPLLLILETTREIAVLSDMAYFLQHQALVSEEDKEQRDLLRESIRLKIIYLAFTGLALE